MQKDDPIFPNFENPPVIEVVCGVHFKEIKKLLAPHIGLLWEKYKPEYLFCREVAPLAPAIEQFADGIPVEFSFSDTPPLPRIWFIHENDNGIIQIQRDRFLHNWRKVKEKDEYPRYPKVIKQFYDNLEIFKSFLAENSFNELSPIQYEMTYINHMYHGEGWETLSDIGEVFPDFSFRKSTSRYLPNPELINWKTSFQLPQQEGRMHTTITSGRRRSDNKKFISLDLTVRGYSKKGMKYWFDLAREWIVCGFADLTGTKMQKDIWKRI